VKLIRRNWLILVGVGAAVVVLAAFGLNRKEQRHYFTVRVDRGEIREVVQATGTIDAVTTVEVGSQVSGTIAELLADFNSRVRQGEVVARIEPSIFEGNLLQAQADLENAEANLAAARANLARSRATVVQAKAEYERTAQLAQEGVMSQQQLEVARANYDSAAAAVSASEAQVAQATAQVNQRRAAVTVARTNLNHTIIRAPIDGIVINRNVDVGQTVAASLQAPTLFTIAQDLTKMQVHTKTDESDVGQIRTEQRVSFRVDAFPRDVFSGRIKQVRMNPTVQQNVVTYDTIIEFDNPEMKLFPGMTAYVTIPVATARDVLRVPNSALRFKPDVSAEEMRAILEQHGIEVVAPGATATAAGGARPAGGQGQGGGQRMVMQGGGQGGQRPSPEAIAAFRARAAARSEGEQPGGGAANSARERRIETGLVWKRGPNSQLIPVQIKTGITDRSLTEVIEVLKGELNEGDEVITGSSARAASGPRAPTALGGTPQRR
jgi:HlyD family secretion protein